MAKCVFCGNGFATIEYDDGGSDDFPIEAVMILMQMGAHIRNDWKIYERPPQSADFLAALKAEAER